VGVEMSFSHLKSKTAFFLSNPEYCRTKDGLIDLICRDCEFWKEDERDYECGAFKLLRLLLEKKLISIEDILNAVSD
jgi:hypothetical protein